MNLIPSKSAFAFFLLAALAGAPPALAEDREAARDAYNSGTAAYDRGDYDSALVQFKRANSLLPSAQALFWVARSLDELGRKEEAIKAYEELIAHPEAGKLGADKLSTASIRLGVLKEAGSKPPEAGAAPTDPVEPAPPPETAAAEEPEPAGAPSEQFVAPEQRAPKFKWTNNLFELGVITGPLFMNSSHNLLADGYAHADYSMVWLLGARAGYYPIPFVGFEADYAHGWAKVKDAPPPANSSGDDRANFDLVRGYVVGQYPITRFVPFAMVGGGIVRAKSERLGKDIDFVLTGALGAKVAVTKFFTPRLDFQLNLTQKKDGGFSEGMALHPAILLGVDFTLNR